MKGGTLVQTTIGGMSIQTGTPWVLHSEAYVKGGTETMATPFGVGWPLSQDKSARGMERVTWDVQERGQESNRVLKSN